MSHDASVQPPAGSILTPDKFPVARGQWLHAEAWGVTEELRDLRYIVLAHSNARWTSKRGRAILAEARAEYEWRELWEIDEHRELDDKFEHWLEFWWESGFRCSVTPEDAERAALHVEATVQVALGATCGRCLPPKIAEDLALTSQIAREAVELALSRKRAKELQLRAGGRLPLTICAGEHPFEFAGCGRVFPDRVFPDSAGRGPSGMMFRAWCDEHQGGQSVRWRDRAESRFLVKQAELRRDARILSGVTPDD